jgi:hypothetical protein
LAKPEAAAEEKEEEETKIICSNSFSFRMNT